MKSEHLSGHKPGDCRNIALNTSMLMLIITCLALFTSGLPCSGQAASGLHLSNASLLDPAKHIVYRGIENVISLRSDSLQTDSILLQAKSGTISGCCGEFKAEAPDSGQQWMLYVLMPDTAGIFQSVDSVIMEIRDIPDPEAIIAGKSGGKIKKEVLLAADSLTVIVRNCYLKKNPWRITSFKLSYTRDYFLYEFEQRDGCRFADQQRSAMSNLHLGAVFHFINIRVKGPKGSIKVLPELTFEISL